MKKILTLLFILIFIASELMSAAKESVSVSIKDLRKAPTEIVLNGRLLSLSVSLWRDFMPSVPSSPDGKPLTGIITVVTSDGKAFPAGVRVDRAWFLFDEQVWEPHHLEEQDLNDPSFKNSQGKYANRPESPVFRIVAQPDLNGPKWGPGVSVDIVVRLTDQNGHHYFLRAENQSIGRVD